MSKWGPEEIQKARDYTGSTLSMNVLFFRVFRCRSVFSVFTFHVSRFTSLVSLWLLLAFGKQRALAAEWSGHIAAEPRLFPQAPLSSAQHKEGNLSIVFQPEFYHEWANGDMSLTVESYLRLDQHDSKRTHFDIRELFWQKVADSWELRIGIGKVFWGVAESQHLVDIINQTDLVENIDGEDKLGQPMVNLTWIQSWGTVDFFILPFFRERTFPGEEGRLRFPLPVDTDHAIYESDAEERHVDWAIRWSHTLGDFDIGAAHFYGTSREPGLVHRGINTWSGNLEKVSNLFKDLSAQKLPPLCTK